MQEGQAKLMDGHQGLKGLKAMFSVIKKNQTSSFFEDMMSKGR